MPKFLFEASYTPQAAEGLRREGGTSRKEAAKNAVESVGGRLESFYFAFGDRDVFVIADLPDNESAAAVSLAVSSSGTMTTNRSVVLLAPEQIDEAAKLPVAFRAPGAS